MYGTGNGTDFERVLSTFAGTMKTMKSSIEELMEKEEVGTRGAYGGEVAAFVHCLGICSIESSALSASLKANLAAGLTGEMAKMLGNGLESMETIEFLERRLELYRWAKTDGRGRDPIARMSLRFLQQFGADTPSYTAMIATLYFHLVQESEALSRLLGSLGDRAA